MTRFAWHCYRRLFFSEDFIAWPKTEEANDLLGIIYLCVGAAMAPMVREKHRQMGIPPEITRDTCLEVSCFCRNHQYSHQGKAGIIDQQLSWLRHYPAGRLFRLGRFEYKLNQYAQSGPVFRHRQYGWKLAFCENSCTFDAQGFRAETGWEALYHEDADSVTGHPIDPHGFAVARQIRIDLTQWERILSPGETIIDLHIPAGGGMKLPLCKASFEAAFDFFSRYFPDTAPDVIACRSWIFNTQFEEHLPSSNLANLMRQTYLTPVPSTGRDGIFFVFCRELTDQELDDAPRETSLQRLMLDLLKSGTPLRSGGMFLHREELPRLGMCPYREDWVAAQQRHVWSPITT